MNKQIKKNHCDFDPPCNYDPETYDGYVICMSCNDHIENSSNYNPLYGDQHEETCPCYEYPAVLDDQLSDCECSEDRFN